MKKSIGQLTGQTEKTMGHFIFFLCVNDRWPTPNVIADVDLAVDSESRSSSKASSGSELFSLLDFSAVNQDLAMI